MRDAGGEVDLDYCIYLDNHSTTLPDPRVSQAVVGALRNFGNPNSGYHCYGVTAAAALGEAKERIASLVNADAAQVRFTSGSTEALRLALWHAVGSSEAVLRVLVSPTEHPAVLDSLAELERIGQVQLRFLEVDRKGRLDVESLLDAARDGADLACIMHANNEIGTISDVATLSSSLLEYGIDTLVDATQSVGRIPVDIQTLGAKYVAFSAHKFNGPKGAGALVTSEANVQRLGRTGTPNVAAIVGMGVACQLRAAELAGYMNRVCGLRDALETRLRKELPGVTVNGDRESRLPGNLSISIPGIPAEALIARVADRVAISSGAACRSGALEPSHVTTAIGLDREQAESTIRFGVGAFNTPAEIEIAARIVVDAARALAQELEDVA